MNKRLVAYFSANGTTRKVAEMIAELAKADLYEIKPKNQYTKDDLNWMDQNSRSSKEMNNKKFRPEIVEDGLNIDQYDEILFGFPIWWYVAPTIVNTFLEKYDFSGKKKFRPEIVEDGLNIDQYDEILFGFPIWWYVAPTIVNTFLEKYDFSGKKRLYGKSCGIIYKSS